jgi:hypothetical protein
MKSKTLALLKFFLWFSCAFHLIVGIGLNLSPAFPQFMAGYYGASVEFTPQFLYILKPLGAFMIMVGLVVMAAARDPLNNGAIVYGLVALLAIRGLQRFAFQDAIVNDLAIESSRNVTNGIVFLALAAIFLVLFKLAEKERSATI